ncbi:taurine catabolism dioxygenase TauD, TfdA family-domain-containing protein [Dipodascopsis uninucleata]
MQIRSYSKQVDKDTTELITEEEVDDNDAIEVKFDDVFLRDSCSCAECVDQDTLQKRFSTAEIPLDITSKVKNVSEEGELEVEWQIAGRVVHNSIYSESFLHQYSSPQNRYDARWSFKSSPIYWDSSNISDLIVRKSYDEYINSEEDFDELIHGLYRTGLAFVTDAPASEQDGDQIVVEKIARKIGYIKETFYGTSWNVIADPNAKNIAYTSKVLPLHMDLLYYESPPGVQLLHCISNDADGGESVYVDSFRAAYAILEHDPAAFEILSTFPITFHYRNDGQHYVQTRPLIELDKYYKRFHDDMPSRLIRHVNYSPPFQAPFDHFCVESSLELQDISEQSKFRDFLNAYQLFHEIINQSSQQYEEKFAPGICALFLNRRILHSRREFRVLKSTNSISLSSSTNASRGRWLKGTYLDIDSFESKLRVLNGI